MSDDQSFKVGQVVKFVTPPGSRWNGSANNGLIIRIRDLRDSMRNHGPIVDIIGTVLSTDHPYYREGSNFSCHFDKGESTVNDWPCPFVPVNRGKLTLKELL